MLGRSMLEERKGNGEGEWLKFIICTYETARKKRESEEGEGKGERV